jgi:hypothetical protein
MTRGAAAQAVHERLEHLVLTMPEPDVEAGWAALVGQLDPPVAPVVRLRRRQRPWRGVVLGIAAAIVVAGAVFAAVHHGGNDERPATVGPSVTVPRPVGRGLHAHHPASEPDPRSHAQPPISRGYHQRVPGTGDGSSPPGPGSGDAPSGSRHHDTKPPHHDSPDDTDHGTGNDGTHDDNGQGNNAQGQDSQGHDTQGNGNGSGNDQGSGTEQGSSDRGTHGSGEGDHPTGGGGSGDDHGSAGQGQGGSHGQNG